MFVGFNPSIRSAETGHHFANPNNRFWKILNEAGLTPRKYSSEEDVKLLDLGYGLTNIVARPTKEAKEITKEEYEVGREQLIQKVNTFKPKVICFVGKGVYQQYAKKQNVDWGVQDEPVSDQVEFVAPSSSGLVRMKLIEVVGIYKEIHPLLTNE
ncbi:mismatch-specific DNA-glycosylase [Aquibacillus sp. 3ASR75-54]|uniref:Mismatch-specific DNA-glycosylase n=1 Tax=Aquibacillus salsiterrae TaxID=2950439 RepID=A0A9X3WEN0_9BACI|nr:mismatch-specific DNA-glycosylase [Aquibacillus salsiterrae]